MRLHPAPGAAGMDPNPRLRSRIRRVARRVRRHPVRAAVIGGLAVAPLPGTVFLAEAVRRKWRVSSGRRRNPVAQDPTSRFQSKRLPALSALVYDAVADYRAEYERQQGEPWHRSALAFTDPRGASHFLSMKALRSLGYRDGVRRLFRQMVLTEQGQLAALDMADESKAAILRSARAGDRSSVSAEAIRLAQALDAGRFGAMNEATKEQEVAACEISQRELLRSERRA